MPSDDTLNRSTRPNAGRGDRGTCLSDRDTAVYVEDGWIFRVKPGAPIECVRETSRPQMRSPDDAPYGQPRD
jgi:hypothetical protein